MKFNQSKYFGFLIILLFLFFLCWSLGPMKSIERKLVGATGSKEMLDLKPFSNSQQIYDYFERVGEPGLEVLAEMYTFQDLIYPLAYGLFFGFYLIFISAKLFPNRKKLMWLSLPTLLMMIADYLENFSILMLMGQPTTRLGLSNYLGLFTTTKWIMGAITLLLFISLTVWFWGVRSWAKNLPVKLIISFSSFLLKV